MTQKEKMIAGQIYDAYDPELVMLRKRCNALTSRLNALDVTEHSERAQVLGELLGSCGRNVFLLNASFDYGFNTHIGDEFSANFNFVVLDCAPVYIGNNVLVGPNVTFAPPVHPLLPDERNFRYDAQGGRHLWEFARPITVGDNVWIASNVVIQGGVTIGEGCVIAAGSVVTKDLPARTVCAGVPCKPLRPITEADRIGF